MITLNASGSSVIFTFSGNSTYLNDGAITVPKNSLALIVDESDMITFRKSASNDIFVSANIAEFGMTKAELESWYKANMVSSSGGGGGVTPEEVEEMIDEAVSGKQDTLIAGENITISGNVISATGGGGTDAPISAGTGSNSVKENYVNNVASGEYSHVEGRGTSASGNSSHAEGNGTSAAGNYAHAEGRSTVASGQTSHAEGELTNANGSYSHAEGTSTKANGSNSHAEGKYSQASGNSSHAEGGNTRANGINSHAEGGGTVANGSNSHTEGDHTIANNQAEHASGMYNVSNTGESTSAQTLFSVGNGGWDETAQDVVRHNAFEIRQNGDIYLTKDGQDVKLQDQLGGGSGGMTEDDELLLATALTDLNDRKIDASEVKSNYQKKGDYTTKDYVATALEPYETKLDEINTEEVAAYAFNELNERLIALETAVQTLQTLHNNE